MGQYLSYRVTEFIDSDLNIYEYLIKKADRFNMFIYKKPTDNDYSDFQKFDAEEIFVFSNAFTDMARYFQLFSEWIERSTIIVFCVDVIVAEELSKKIKMTKRNYYENLKLCIARIDEYSMSELIKIFDKISQSITFYDNTGIIAQLSKLPDHISCQVFKREQSEINGCENDLLESKILSVTGRTDLLCKDYATKELLPFLNEDEPLYAFLSFYDKNNKEILYFNSCSGYVTVCLTEQESAELRMCRFNLENFELLWTDNEYDSLTSPNAISDNFDLGIVDEDLADII